MSQHSHIAAQAAVHAPRSASFEGVFGRMFRNLSPWSPQGVHEEERIRAIFKLSEELFASPAEEAAADNPNLPAAYTYFGQFIDHDLTFDPTSSLQRRNDVDRIANFRTPRFDLDCVYGRGPDAQPYLYQASASSKLLIGASEAGEPDLPRSLDASADPSPGDPFDRRRAALIGDPRNDENIIVSQLQLAFLRLHNVFVDSGNGFEEACRLTRWHYQWVVIHDFVKRLCGAAVVDDLLGSRGRPRLEFYRPRYQPFMPVEFSGAAYRLGHSMVRPSYDLSEKLRDLRGGAPLQIFGGAPRDHLGGGRELPSFWTLQWDQFVEHEGSQPQLSRRINLDVAPPLRTLPMPSGDPRFRSLTFRNLLRGWRMDLPSGQSVARRMAVATQRILEGDDPLWVYVLKEAREHRNGQSLGDMGARLVAEVFVGLLAGDPQSYYSIDPLWAPDSRDFDLAALLDLSGAPMTQAEAEALQPRA